MFLDTSGLLCFHHKAEPQHAEAVRFVQSASNRLTHSYVLAEFVALAQARGLPRQPALAFVADLQDNTAVQVILFKVVVGGQRFLDAMLLHQEETHRIAQRPVLSCDPVP